jgi:hypothetical protein
MMITPALAFERQANLGLAYLRQANLGLAYLRLPAAAMGMP